MTKEKKTEGMLSPYRVLDLTDEKGLLCGKLLGDLGADVIKVERPGGDPARNIGPFYHDEVDPEKSLFWFAFNASKRGITLDIETADGQETFKRLVETADFVIESFPLGYMDKLGLGYSALEKVNPGIIMVSITPFGQTGPYKDYKTSDIVAWSMGGQQYAFGDPDRPPIRISYDSQAYLNASLQAAAGAMIALHHRKMTGEGQHLDISIQEAVVRIGYLQTCPWEMQGVLESRAGGVQQRRAWTCKDGYLNFFFQAGGRGSGRSAPIIQWIEEEGMADDFLKEFDWEGYDFTKITPDVRDRLTNAPNKLFMAHTKAELLDEAVKRNIQLFPSNTTKDILESVQLAARGYWAEVEHPELGTTLTYPGAFAKASETPPRPSRRAPLIGEHNQEILKKELALSKKKLLTSRQAKGNPAKLNKESQRENLAKKPLEGIKVVEFTFINVGPLTGRQLCDYGAEVIKIEGRRRPDQFRTMVNYSKDGIAGFNRAGGFAETNAGKLSIALDLAKPKAMGLAKKFIARADVVIENFAGGVLTRMGLGYEELKKVKPDIIMLSACMMGQTGPYYTARGLGAHLTGLTGISEITGWPDRLPLGLGQYTDFIAPHFNALAIMAALDYRDRTGKGQYLDMSQCESVIHFMAPLILDYEVNQRIAKRMGNRYQYAAPHNAYRCRGEERWCAIAVFTDEEWQSFSKVIGNPAWTADPKFSTLPARKENEEELDRLVEAWTINHSAEEVMSLMQAAGVAAGVVQNSQDIMEHDPQVKHRHIFWEFDHPEIGKYHARGPAYGMSKTPGEVRGRAPLLGEHNEYALKELLGMSDEEIVELVIEGALE